MQADDGYYRSILFLLSYNNFAKRTVCDNCDVYTLGTVEVKVTTLRDPETKFAFEMETNVGIAMVTLCQGDTFGQNATLTAWFVNRLDDELRTLSDRQFAAPATQPPDCTKVDPVV